MSPEVGPLIAQSQTCVDLLIQILGESTYDQYEYDGVSQQIVGECVVKAVVCMDYGMYTTIYYPYFHHKFSRVIFFAVPISWNGIIIGNVAAKVNDHVTYPISVYINNYYISPYRREQLYVIYICDM